jgi:hypothetical protein
VLGRPRRDRAQATKLEVPFGHAFDKLGVSSPKSVVRACVPSVCGEAFIRSELGAALARRAANAARVPAVRGRPALRVIGTAVDW